MFYREREQGRITEARESLSSPIQNLAVDFRFFLGNYNLPGGYPMSVPRRKGDPEEYTPHHVIFTDFKASLRPEQPTSGCVCCHRSLRWKPGCYSFTEPYGITFTVPQMGWWRCPGGHPGKVDMQDFSRYAQVGKQFKEYLQEQYGEFQVRYGRISPKGR